MKNKIMFKFSVLLGFILILYIKSFAQYHLGEFGGKINVGVSVPFNQNSPTILSWDPIATNMKIGPSVGLEGFYSHYVCGKSYGYHFSAGVRYLRFKYDVLQKISIVEPLNKWADETGDLLNGELGAYFKIRKHNYHRPKELNLLIGPKFNIIILKNSSELLKNRTGVNATTQNWFAIHASLWQRLPLGKKRSFFLTLESDFFPFAYFEANKYSCINVSLGGGLTFWSTR